MAEFKRFHPIVNILYFMSVILLSVVLMNPFCLTASLFGSLLYSLIVCEKKQVGIWAVSVFVLTVLLNPLFNHEGATILMYFKSGNPLTLESIIYGAASGAMLVSVILWFSAFNKIVTSDQLMYVFGKLSPSVALVFSMALRFVPNLKENYRKIRNAQKSLGRCGSGFISRFRCGVTEISALVSMTLENSAATADSMKSRGFATGKRTMYTVFKFEFRDKLILTINIFCVLYVIAGGMSGAMSCTYFPSFAAGHVSPYGISVFAAFSTLCLLPSIIEIREAARWAALKRKI